MRKAWLLFSQTVTVAVALLFVVATLKPEWLARAGAGRGQVVTIVSAAAGTWTLYIPYSEFTNKEGGRLSYEAYMTDGTYRTGLIYGFLDVLERG